MLENVSPRILCWEANQGGILLESHPPLHPGWHGGVSGAIVDDFTRGRVGRLLDKINCTLLSGSEVKICMHVFFAAAWVPLAAAPGLNSPVAAGLSYLLVRK